MGTFMAIELKTVRLVVQTDEDLRFALKLEAVKRGLDMSELADEILREALATSLAEIQKRREGGKKGGRE